MASAFAMSNNATLPPPTQPQAAKAASTTAITPTAPPAPAWQRQVKQLGLFFMGAGFMAASVAVSRRAVVRRRLETIPKFYVSNRDPGLFDSADRSALAAQALGLATLNVMSFGVLLAGGVSWAFDLCSVTELQVRSREAIRRTSATNPEEEAEMEKMMSDLLARWGLPLPVDDSAGGGGAKKDGQENGGSSSSNNNSSSN